MKRILLAFLLMLPAINGIERATSDPMPPPCLPCPVPKPNPGNQNDFVIELPYSIR